MLLTRSGYLDTLDKFRDKPVIKVLTGLRRSGKSSLLKLMVERLKTSKVQGRNILYIDKESLEFDAIRTYKDLQKRVSGYWKGVAGPKYLFVDEVQEISEWERAIASLAGAREADIYLSGSNSHLLSSELATLLSGRYIEISVLPLSFGEFLRFKAAKGALDPVESEFDNYLKYGGMPGLHQIGLSEDVAFQYLNSIFNTILYKDVVSRHKIRDTAILDRIARFAFDNCGNVLSAQRIAEYMKSQRIKVSVDTVLNYMAYLESAFLLRKARRFDIQGKRHLEVNDKYYLGDVGLRHGFIGYRESDISGLLENIVYLELKRRGYAVSVGKWQTREIDFVAEKDQTRLYIQVCYLLADPSTVAREFGPLMEVNDNHPKLVLSMDRNWGDGRDGIRRIYLPDFLLEEEKDPIMSGNQTGTTPGKKQRGKSR